MVTGPSQHRMPPGCYAVPDTIGLPRVFRYFEKREEAEALCEGQVWLTTIERCRNHEKINARDEMEGKRLYTPGLIAGSSDDPANSQRAQRAGLGGMNFTNSIILLGTVEQRSPDAYIFCSTVRHDANAMEGLGDFCVEIQQPCEFANQLLGAVHSEFPRIDRADFQLVVYKLPSFAWDDPEPGGLMFTKDPDEFAHEQEARILFRPTDEVPLVGLQPRLFHVPAAARLCRLLV